MSASAPGNKHSNRSWYVVHYALTANVEHTNAGICNPAYWSKHSSRRQKTINSV